MRSPLPEDTEALKRARKLIAEGQTLLIAIDSNAFFEGTGKDRKVNFNLEWICKFRGLVRGREKLLLSSVWDVEIRRHFTNSIDSNVQVTLPKFSRVDSNRKEIDRLQAMAAELRRDAGELVEKEWDSVKISLNAELVSVPEHSELARKIFDMWSSSSWPFEPRKEKRDEFQDAFALLSLQAYAENLRAQPGCADSAILVVTSDHGCREFCKLTNSLIPCSDVTAAVDLLSQRQEILRLADRSLALSELLSDPGNSIHQNLYGEFSSCLQQLPGKSFPPPEFTFCTEGPDKSGWLGFLALRSIVFLPSGPRGAKIEVLQDQSDLVSIRGRVQLCLLVSLNEPRYEHAAVPSSNAVMSNRECTWEVEFEAFMQDGRWWVTMNDSLRHLCPLSDAT